MSVFLRRFKFVINCSEVHVLITKIYIFFFVFLLQLIVSIMSSSDCNSPKDIPVQNHNGLYTIVGSGTIKSKAEYNATVAVHDAPTPLTIKIGLNGPEFSDSQTWEIAPHSSRLIQFSLPKLKDGEYYLTAEGISGLEFKNTTHLFYARDRVFIYIQTDKAIYRPGDKIQFRVLILDENNRPATSDEPVNVVITDATFNWIRQWNDVKLTKGVFTNELQLPEFPVLGTWKLEVFANGDENSQSFDVDKEYLLPNFEMQIEAPSDFAIVDVKIPITVQATYLYGKPVKGKAVITVEPYYSNAGIFTAEKTILVDGKGHTEFDIYSELNMDKDRLISPLIFLAEFEDELTGLKQSCTTTVYLHHKKYQIQAVDSLHMYTPGKPLTITIAVKALDGSPIQDTTNPVTLTVSPPQNWKRYFRSKYGQPKVTRFPPKPKTIKLTSFLNEDGMVKFEVTIANGTIPYYPANVNYLDSTMSLSLSMNTEICNEDPLPLEITVQTKNPKLGEDVFLKLTSLEPIPYFVYSIVGRNDIVQSDFIDVPDKRNYHVFKFTPTLQMVPSAKIFIYYIVGTELKYIDTSIEFERDFENSISIDAPLEAKPGEDIKIKVTTDPESFVCLLGVDRRVLQQKSGNDFSRNDIFYALESYEFVIETPFRYEQYPGNNIGTVILTNANFPLLEDELIDWLDRARLFRCRDGAYANADHPIARKLFSGSRKIAGANASSAIVFPKKWLFVNAENTDDNGITFNMKVPDTITSWVITGFSMSPKTGLALTHAPSKISVFKPFFVSTNLPYSVTRGEVIAIPVIVFNYMGNDLDAEITLDNSEKAFEFAETIHEVTESTSDDIKRINTLSIPADSGKSISFLIRPKIIGSITLKITAISPLAADEIHQSLIVEPEGVKTVVNKEIFINLVDTHEVKHTVDIDIPSNAVPDSEYLTISVVGNPLGPTFDNLYNPCRKPFGTGKWTMARFVLNTTLLKYLTTINRLPPHYVSKAKESMKIGYEEELQYRLNDGSHGSNYQTSNTWWTAFVVKLFHQAIPFTDIDPNVLETGLQFLAGIQKPSGEFPEVGNIQHIGSKIGLTAFVVLAFLENAETAPKYKENIDKALDYLEQELPSTDEKHLLAIALLALVSGGRHQLTESIVNKIDALKKIDDDRPLDSDTTFNYYKWFETPYIDVQIVSYVAMALIRSNSVPKAFPYINYLFSKQRERGGFQSVQSAVDGLQALTEFAEWPYSRSSELEISFIDGKDTLGKISVTPKTCLVLQTHVLPKTTKQIQISAEGNGLAVVQVSCRYNLKDDCVSA